MIPWLLVTQLLMDTGQSLSDLVAERIGMYPCSGEVNFRVEDIVSTIEAVHTFYRHLNPVLDRMDGLCMTFADWRINIRASNTEPLLRVNIESRGSMNLVKSKLEEVSAIIANHV